jgi:hypothetical protein
VGEVLDVQRHSGSVADEPKLLLPR